MRTKYLSDASEIVVKVNNTGSREKKWRRDDTTKFVIVVKIININSSSSKIIANTVQ